MHHSSFDLGELVSGALSRNKSSASDDSKKVEMLCEGCRTKLGLAAFKRKKQCGECHLTYCTNCLTLPNSSSSTTMSSPSVFTRFIDRSTSKQYCRKCHILRARPLCRADLQRLRVKDLQQYLKSHDVSCKGCVEKEDLVNLLIRYVGSSGSYNDIRQTSSTTSDNSQSEHVEDPPPGYCSYSQTSRRSSVPNIHSPTAESPPAPSNVEQSTPRPTILEPQMSSNMSRSAMREREYNTMPEVSSPVSESASVTSSPRDGGNVETRLDVEELTNWEDLGAEAAEMGPEPLVTEVDDELDVAEDSESGSRSGNIDSNDELDENSDTGIQVSAQIEEIETSSQAQESSFQISRHIELSSIKSINDLEQLTVKQLKELLIRNRVDFRGCVEKAELTERANRLWLESVQARKELENLSMDELCKICMDAPVECVMLECGHMATCTACGKQLNECPICRQYVVRVVRIFKA